MAFLPLGELDWGAVGEGTTLAVSYGMASPAPRLADYGRDLWRIARELEGHPEVRLELPTHGYEDLEFLKEFPFLKKLSVQALEATNLEGLRFVPEVEDLRIVACADGGCLRHTPKVESLILCGPLPERLELGHAEELRYLKVWEFEGQLDVRALAACPRLEAVSLMNGAVRHMDMLCRLPELHALELYGLRGIEDWSFLGSLAELRWLSVIRQRTLTALPPMEGTSSLYQLTLGEMKGLSDLTGLVRAKALRELNLVSMRHLRPEQLEAIRRVPGLREFSAVSTSRATDRAMERVVGLPRPPRLSLPEVWGMPVPAAEEYEAWRKPYVIPEAE